jgi:hypothetical protein
MNAPTSQEPNTSFFVTPAPLDWFMLSCQTQNICVCVCVCVSTACVSWCAHYAKHVPVASSFYMPTVLSCFNPSSRIPLVFLSCPLHRAAVLTMAKACLRTPIVPLVCLS